MYLFDAATETMTTSTEFLWKFLPVGYLLTILIETPILFLFLPSKVTTKEKLFCGAWLTACTYPIVVLVLAPLLMDQSRPIYLLVAETFAPVAECTLFWAAFRRRAEFVGREWIVAFAAIVGANLASFAAGEMLNVVGWFGWF